MNRIYTGRGSATIIGIVALYLCALSAYVVLGVRDIVGAMMGDVRVSVELSSSERVDPLAARQALEGIDGVRSAQYIYGAQADSEFSKFIGEDITAFMGERVLPSTFLLTVESSCSLEALSQRVAENSWVGGIYYESSVVSAIVERTEFITRLVRVVAIVIAIFAFIVILYSIKLMVGAQFRNCKSRKHRLLRRMVYRWAWVSGVLGSIFAVALLYFTVSYLTIFTPELGLSYASLPLIAAGTVVVGVLVSLLSTYISLLSYYRQQ